jgi:hypothetical protein
MLTISFTVDGVQRKINTLARTVAVLEPALTIFAVADPRRALRLHAAVRAPVRFAQLPRPVGRIGGGASSVRCACVRKRSAYR